MTLWLPIVMILWLDLLLLSVVIQPILATELKLYTAHLILKVSEAWHQAVRP